ncbi:MAG: glycosyltransferase family 39 protein [Candidatus Omnitrophica bacterium]|nr:glycosyltransferase family 39 protein [Candidatus Omnitrophota bacterium]
MKFMDNYLLFLTKEKVSIKILYLTVVLIIALFLRLYCMDSFSFSYDEASHLVDNRSIFSIAPLDKFFDAGFTVKNHDFLKLYDHGFIYYWKKIAGDSERNLRFSSLIFSLLSIILVYKIGKKYFSEKAACIAVALIAISPFHIYYAQELRPYAAIGFISLVAIYSFIKYLNQRKTSYLCIYIISSIANIYAHFVTITLTCAMVVYLLIGLKRYRRLISRLILAHVLILALTLPVWIIIANNLKLFLLCNLDNFRIVEYPIWLEKVRPVHVFNTLKNMSIGYNLDYSSLTGKIAAIVYFFLFCFGIFKYRAKAEARILAMCFLVPLLLLFMISQIKACYVDRYFFPGAIIYILGAAIGLSKIKGKLLVFLLAAIIGINIMALKNYYNNLYPDSLGINERFGISEKTDIRPLVNYLASNYKSGDIILHTWKGNVFPLRYYVPIAANDAALEGACNRGLVIDYDLASNEFFRLEYNTLHPYVNRMEKFHIEDVGGKLNRVWVIKFNKDDWLIEYLKNNNYEQMDDRIFNRNKLYYFIKK